MWHYYEALPTKQKKQANKEINHPEVKVLMLVHKQLGVVTVPTVPSVFFLLKENFILWSEHIQYLFLQVAYVLVSRS